MTAQPLGTSPMYPLCSCTCRSVGDHHCTTANGFCMIGSVAGRCITLGDVQTGGPDGKGSQWGRPIGVEEAFANAAVRAIARTWGVTDPPPPLPARMLSTWVLPMRGSRVLRDPRKLTSPRLTRPRRVTSTRVTSACSTSACVTSKHPEARTSDVGRLDLVCSE